ncbi:MAG: ABC transporter permease [Bacteroidales bacterium]|nr:ABC transporter permease [Bacteroidales bacterium]
MINTLFKPILERLPENNKLERIWILAKTDFIQRYYGTKLGIVWALINPFFQLIIYYVVFTMLFAGRIPNFALYLFSGLITMMFFSESTSKGLTLLNKYKLILENINMKKLDLFHASLLSNLMGFAFNFFIYLVFSQFFSVEYNLNFLYVPLIILNLYLFVFAVQLILGILNVYFRDVNHLWDMILLASFWSSPVFYGKEVIIDNAPILLYANPLAGILINLRETSLYGAPPMLDILLLNFFQALILLAIASIIFKKYSAKAIEIL